jgi:hypothetical protein
MVTNKKNIINFLKGKSVAYLPDKKGGRSYQVVSADNPYSNGDFRDGKPHRLIGGVIRKDNKGWGISLWLDRMPNSIPNWPGYKVFRVGEVKTTREANEWINKRWAY